MEQVKGPQWVSWVLFEAWISGKVLGELKVELEEALPWRTGWMALLGGQFRTSSLGCRRWTTPKAPRVLAWAGLGATAQ